MATIKQILDICRSFAPEQYMYSLDYDNVGLMVGNENEQVTKVLCCLDCTYDVLKQAKENNANLIISHHPFIFSPIKNIRYTDVLGKKILYAIKNGINIYSAHTNLDFVNGGINDYICEILRMSDIQLLEPYIDDKIGLGRVGILPKKMTALEIKQQLSALLDDNYIQITGNEDDIIQKVAIINGAGGGDYAYIDRAKQLGANCLITAEVKHHIALYAKEQDFTIIEPQHYTMEAVFIPRLVEILKREIKKDGLNINVERAKQRSPKI